MVGSRQEVKSTSGDSHPSIPLDGAVVKHSFNLAWRVLDCLPPSVEFFKSLQQDLEMQHIQVTVSRIHCTSGLISSATWSSVTSFDRRFSFLHEIINYWELDKLSVSYLNNFSIICSLQTQTWLKSWICMYFTVAFEMGVEHYLVISPSLKVSRKIQLLIIFVSSTIWKDPDLAKLLCSLKFVSKLGSSSPDTTFCETLKVCQFPLHRMLYEVVLPLYGRITTLILLVAEIFLCLRYFLLGWSLSSDVCGKD